MLDVTNEFPKPIVQGHFKPYVGMTQAGIKLRCKVALCCIGGDNSSVKGYFIYNLFARIRNWRDEKKLPRVTP